MTLHFLLASLIGVMLRFISRVSLRRYIKTGETNEQLREHFGFHVTVIAYLVGSFLFYVGTGILLAYLVKTHILT
jgi:uncharacterized membrane protein